MGLHGHGTAHVYPSKLQLAIQLLKRLDTGQLFDFIRVV